MITVFDCVQPWPHKVNFIDETKIVGYEMNQHCCENAGWSVLGVEDDDVNLTHKQVADALERHWDYDFNDIQGLVSFEVQPKNTKSRYEIQFEFVDVEPLERSPACLDGGGCILFPLQTVSPEVYGNSKYYLVLYNGHNGYYSHGFNYNLGEHKDEGGI